MPLNSIPNTGQTLDQTRDGIRDNFNVINTAFSVDHVSFNILPDQGKHNKVTFPAQAADPGLAANEMALYTKLVAGNPALFIKDQNLGTVVNFTSAVKNNTGRTTLPSGIVVQWGYGLTDANGEAEVLFAPAFTACYVALATASRRSGDAETPNENQIIARVDRFSTTRVNIRTLRIAALGGNPQPAHFSWVAIGV